MEFRKKKEKNCLTPYLRGSEVGDAYSYLAHKRDTDFFIGFTVGKWDDETCNDFYKMLASRLRFPTRKRRVTIFSDGNKQNITGIENNFPQCAVNYAMRKKIKQGQKVVGIVSGVIFGNSKLDQISIHNIDGFCSKLRERISCYTRKARSFAKKRLCIEQRLEIFSVQHNFMEVKKGQTPAMKEGLTVRKWTWESFFKIQLSSLI